MHGWLDKFTGAEIARKVDEYTEVVGTILVGLHADTENMQRQIAVHSRAIEELKAAKREQAATLQRLQHELQNLQRSWQTQLSRLSEAVQSVQSLERQQAATLQRLQHELQNLQRSWQTQLSRLSAETEARIALQVHQRLRNSIPVLIHHELQRQIASYETTIRNLRRYCALAYLLIIILGVLLWTVK